MKVEILIQAIFLGQFFAAGCIYTDQISWARTTKEKIGTYALTLGTMCFGVLFIPLALIMMVYGLLKRLIDHFHIPFIIKYMVFGKEIEIKPDRLQKIHQAALAKNPKWYQISDKIFIWIDSWVYKKYSTQTT